MKPSPAWIILQRETGEYYDAVTRDTLIENGWSQSIDLNTVKKAVRI